MTYAATTVGKQKSQKITHEVIDPPITAIIHLCSSTHSSTHFQVICGNIVLCNLTRKLKDNNTSTTPLRMQKDSDTEFKKQGKKYKSNTV